MAFLNDRSQRRRRFHRISLGVLAFLGLFALTLNSPGAAAPSAPSPAIQVEAAFLFNFAQFVEWPARAFATPQTPLVIAVLGEDPFGSYLDELVKGEKIGDRPILIRRFRRPEEITECHILFINRSEASQLPKIILTLKERCILTVGDTEDFSRQGGMVRFVNESGKVRLRINLVAAKAAELTISSKILRPATIVSPTTKDSR